MYKSAENASNVPSYSKVAFNGRFQRLVKMRNARRELTTRGVSQDEAKTLAAAVRLSLETIADDETIVSVLNHNPATIRLVEHLDAHDPAFLSYLPLTMRGLDALTNGRLNRLQPDLSLLSREGEGPAAIYIWCIHAPGNFITAISAIAAHFEAIAPQGVPLFTSAANAHAASIFAKLGFARGTEHFPRIADDIIVVLPTTVSGGARSTHESPVVTRVGRTLDDVMKVFAIRAATYMNEQACPYDEEFDGNDFCAAHILGEIDGEPAGCIRVRFFGDFVKFERLAVRPEFRSSTLAFRLVRAAIDYARMKGFRQVYGHARADLVGFWERFGFKTLESRPVFAFSGVPYVEMAGAISPSNRALRIGDPPLTLIRPEGLWDRPGPLDRSAVRGLAA